MSGHNKWSQIRGKKGITDQKRGQLFSKLLKAISIAAKPGSETSVVSQSAPQSGASRSSTSWKTEPRQSTINEHQYSPRLRAAIQKAKENNVPQENIERSINKASEEKNLEEIIIEAYGPEGIAIIIEGITDNKNRAVNEIRHILDENNAKMATPGSVLWAFNPPTGGENGWQPKFPQNISEEAKMKLKNLIEKIEEHEDVQKVITNI